MGPEPFFKGIAILMICQELSNQIKTLIGRFQRSGKGVYRLLSAIKSGLDRFIFLFRYFLIRCGFCLSQLMFEEPVLKDEDGNYTRGDG